MWFTLQPRCTVDWGTPGNHWKFFEILTSFQWPRNREKVNQSHPKPPKMTPEACPGTRKTLNFSKTANLTKTTVFTMFSAHPGIASWCHVHSQIKKKTTLESTLQLGGPNYEKNRQHDSKVAPKGLPKSINKLLKSKSGPQGAPHYLFKKLDKANPGSPKAFQNEAQSLPPDT